MNFKKIDRNEYIKANKTRGDFEELLNRKCDICKKREWSTEIKSDDGASFDCLVGFGCKDGSAFVCDNCFKSHFENHTWTFDKLFV